jgi:hypothetical protein
MLYVTKEMHELRANPLDIALLLGTFPKQGRDVTLTILLIGRQLR